MSKSNYPGIDYSGPGSTTNRDPETGIRYGVISQNSIPAENLDGIEYDYGIPDEGTCPDCGHTQRVPSGCAWGDTIECEECKEKYEVELPDMSEPCGWSYESGGYQLRDCLNNDIFVIKSPYFTYAQFCSPCVPGACNLDNPFEGLAVPSGRHASFAEDYGAEAEAIGYVKCYCLGHDFFEDRASKGGKFFSQAPYEVFSVASGKRVVMKDQEIECRSCKGSGWWRGHNQDAVQCGNCRGSGKEISKVEVEQ